MKTQKIKDKILVTGGAGFIGFNLCKKLVENSNNDVYSLDNYFTGSEQNHVEGVTYIKGNTKNIDKLIYFTPSIIYHLGEYSRVEQSFEEIELVIEFNKLGTFAVLEFVRKRNCKIIYAGSSTKFATYDEKNNSLSPYSWSKASNTDLVNNYASWFDINYAITYFYNAYGPGEIKTGKYATLIAIFQNQKENNLPLTVVSPGTQKRNFTHVYDIVNGLILLGEKGYGDGFGIGSSKTYEIIEVAKMFDCKIKFLPERKGNRMNSELIIDNTKKLGWEAKYDLELYIQNIK